MTNYHNKASYHHHTIEPFMVERNIVHNIHIVPGTKDKVDEESDEDNHRRHVQNRLYRTVQHCRNTMTTIRTLWTASNEREEEEGGDGGAEKEKQDWETGGSVFDVGPQVDPVIQTRLIQERRAAKLKYRDAMLHVHLPQLAGQTCHEQGAGHLCFHHVDSHMRRMNNTLPTASECIHVIHELIRIVMR
jgi:hypothetical protein